MGLFILFPKCAINAAFRKQNSIPYFLGQLIYAALYQYIIPNTFASKEVYVFICECGVSEYHENRTTL